MYKTLLGTQGFRKVASQRYFLCGSSDEIFRLKCSNHLYISICYRELISILKDMMSKQ